MQIHRSNILTTKYLNRIFNKTVTTYKYYFWVYLTCAWSKGKRGLEINQRSIMQIDYLCTKDINISIAKGLEAEMSVTFHCL